MTDDQLSNTPEYSVSELSGALKRRIEDEFGHVRVRGEISGYRGPHSSGHAYFALKDDGAKIDAVVWKGIFGRMRFRPEEGMEVIATGKLTTFPGSSKYQIVIESLEPAGVGALMALVEERRKKLTAEGLFDAGRKQLLPYMPAIIGVVTSPTGAVIRDILHRIADRFPCHVIVWPVRVQGETSGAEVAAAINGFNALSSDDSIQRPDLIIVARGGGSLEDLWGFNDEIVVRAAANSDIPLISAVGHESDWTLIDHAADVRAPTPTAAAEMAVPVRLELLGTCQALGGRLAGAILRGQERRRNEFRGLARVLGQGETLLNVPRQRLDRAGGRLAPALQQAISGRNIALARIGQRLSRKSPQSQLAAAQERLRAFANGLQAGHLRYARDRAQKLVVINQRLAAALTGFVREQRRQNINDTNRVGQLGGRLLPALSKSMQLRHQNLIGLEKLRSSLGYEQVLARGFALVRDASGHPLRNVDAARAQNRLEIQFSDGRIQVSPADGPPPKPKKSNNSSSDKSSIPQGSLF